MSTLTERESLLSERAFLQRSLAGIPTTARLTRNSKESRLRVIDERIARLPAAGAERTRVLLTFRGKPVIGSQGIFADFGSKAVSSFNDAVAAVAASLNGGLARMGPIPNRDANQLMITGTAIGSFGFELQAVPQLDDWTSFTPTQVVGNQLIPLGNAVNWPDARLPGLVKALQYTHDLLQGTMEPDDERLADAASDLDQRAIDKVRNFVSVLADNEAVCAIDSGPSRRLVFTDAAQIRSSVLRLSQDNVHEARVVVQGRFAGLLPGRRSFEFVREDDQLMLAGKVSPSVPDPDQINHHLGELTTVQLMQTRIGNGRPRFQLLELPQWGALPAA